MKRRKEDIELLRAELNSDSEQIENLYLTNRKAEERINASAVDYLDYAALGYTIHNLYSLMENGCFRIAKFFENNISDSSWHKELLDRMRLNIEGIRPAFLDDETYYILDDLRAFRHLFRNLYARPIDRDKLLLVQNKVSKAVSGFKTAVKNYDQFLNDLKEEIT